jgi:hypothetical protein
LKRGITCGAKVFAQMSGFIRLYCQLLNQLNFFLLERAMSEVQTLYQTYLSRTNLRRRKSQKPNTSKKALATFLQVEKFLFLNYFE